MHVHIPTLFPLKVVFVLLTILKHYTLGMHLLHFEILPPSRIFHHDFDEPTVRCVPVYVLLLELGLVGDHAQLLLRYEVLYAFANGGGRLPSNPYLTQGLLLSILQVKDVRHNRDEQSNENGAPESK